MESVLAIAGIVAIVAIVAIARQEAARQKANRPVLAALDPRLLNPLRDLPALTRRGEEKV